MYQDIAVARGSTYDTLNARMDRCQANIETISDDIQLLQVHLADEETSLEELRIDEITRKDEYDIMKEQMKAVRAEEERVKEEERKEKYKIQRDKVIRELISTEREYCRHMALTIQAFRGEVCVVKSEEDIDWDSIFTNMSSIINISHQFQDRLSVEMEPGSDTEAPEVTSGKARIGSCFLSESTRMKVVYTEYCLLQERALHILEKYENDPVTHKLLQAGLERLRADISCLNLRSILIKPVQRIAQYPLLLAQLRKYTETDNSDLQDLKLALENMSNIAASINETKRKKDIVDKYKNGECATLSSRITKLNMHSIGKKSSRLSQKLLNSLGFDGASRDEDFEELERLFYNIHTSLTNLINNLERVKGCIHKLAVSQFNTSHNISEYYKDSAVCEVDKFESAHSYILSHVWNQFNEVVESRILCRLRCLLSCLTGPSRLIQKRNDKLLDYSRVNQRKEKNKDASKYTQLSEELESAKTQYLALNGQLVNELPQLVQVSMELYNASIREYILARKIFLGRATKQLLELMELPLTRSSCGDILEVFLIKHSLVANQISRFSFVSKSFKPEEKKDESEESSNTCVQWIQTNTQRTYLRNKYSGSKLYQVKDQVPCGGQLDLAAKTGDLIAVIQNKDPSGNRDRWYCDNGHKQGFLNASCLSPLGQTPPELAAIPGSASVPGSAVTTTNPVGPTSASSTNHEFKVPVSTNYCGQQMFSTLPHPPAKSSSSTTNDMSYTLPRSQQLKPGVSNPVQGQARVSTLPRNTFANQDFSMMRLRTGSNNNSNVATLMENNNNNGTSVLSKEDTQNKLVAVVPPYDEVADDTATCRPTRPAPPPPGASATQGKIPPSLLVGGKRRDPEQQSQHSYEEISAMEIQSQINDLSPIYEEIPGGSRSSMSSGSGSGKLSNSPRGKFYLAVYSFQPEEHEITMLTIQKGQVLRVLQVSGEWWYVESRTRERGYVPASYIKPYTSS